MFLPPLELVPLGEATRFHSPGHTQDENRECLAFYSMLASTAEVKTSHLCFVLESRSTYEDLLSNFFPDSDVQRGLERMFSVELLGIKEQEMSNYDEQMVALFRQSISFKDNKYYIQLPWESDKVTCVPLNQSVAIRVLDHVAWRLECNELYRDYLDFFRQQEHDGIIEEIFVLPSAV